MAGRPSTRAKVILDELRLDGRYPDAAQRAASLAKATSETMRPDFDSWTLAEVEPLLRQHASRTEFQLYIPVQQWAGEAGFLSYSDLLNDIYLSNWATNAETSKLQLKSKGPVLE